MTSPQPLSRQEVISLTQHVMGSSFFEVKFRHEECFG